MLPCKHLRYFEKLPTDLPNAFWLAPGEFFAQEIPIEEKRTASGIVIADVKQREGFESNRPLYYQILIMGPTNSEIEEFIPNLKVGNVVLLGPVSFQEMSYLGPFISDKDGRFIRASYLGVVQRFENVESANQFEEYLRKKLKETPPEGNR